MSDCSLLLFCIFFLYGCDVIKSLHSGKKRSVLIQHFDRHAGILVVIKNGADVFRKFVRIDFLIMRISVNIVS